MRWWKFSGSGIPASVLRLAIRSAALAIGVATVSGAGSAMAAEACRVQFTEVRLERPTNAPRTLYRGVLVGEHNYSAASNTGASEITRFEIVDNDAFLVLAVFAARWGSGGDGAIDRNPRTVRVPRAEIESLKRAVEYGQTYYRLGLERISVEPRPSNYEAVREVVVKKQRLLDEILVVLNETSDYRAADGTVVLGSLPWFNLQMARFRPDSGGDLRSQYRDSVIEGAPPNLLCDPAARSAVVGKLACPAAPGGSDAGVTGAPCPEGLTFSPILFPPPQP